MTTETRTKCTAIVGESFNEGEEVLYRPCGAEARWLDWFDGPRCEEHAVGHCRRIGPVEGTED